MRPVGVTQQSRVRVGARVSLEGRGAAQPACGKAWEGERKRLGRGLRTMLGGLILGCFCRIELSCKLFVFQ